MDDRWALEPDTCRVTGMTGRPAGQEIHDLISGCEMMLKLPWPTLPPRDPGWGMWARYHPGFEEGGR